MTLITTQSKTAQRTRDRLIMNTSLEQTKAILHSMVSALESAVSTLPQQGDTKETCVRLGILNVLCDVNELIDELKETHLLESDYNPADRKGCLLTAAYEQVSTIKDSLLEVSLKTSSESKSKGVPESGGLLYG